MAGRTGRAALALAAAVVACLAFAPGALAHGHRQVNAHVYFEAALTSPNTLTVAYQCTGGSWPPAAAVEIRCGIYTMRGLTLPGPVSVFSEGEIIPNEPFQLCWRATAFYGGSDTLVTSDCHPPTTSPVGWDSSYTAG